MWQWQKPSSLTTYQMNLFTTENKAYSPLKIPQMKAFHEVVYFKLATQRDAKGQTNQLKGLASPGIHKLPIMLLLSRPRHESTGRPEVSSESQNSAE